MAGYSGTPLVKKLGIKPGARLALVNAPDGFADTLGDLPADVEVSSKLASNNDVILFFTKSHAELKKQFPRLQKVLNPDGGLWICWPKKAAKIPTDLTENVIRAHALGMGLVDNKVCAVDEIWSGLRLVVRLRDRPKPQK